MTQRTRGISLALICLVLSLDTRMKQTSSCPVRDRSRAQSHLGPWNSDTSVLQTSSTLHSRASRSHSVVSLASAVAQLVSMVSVQQSGICERGSAGTCDRKTRNTYTFDKSCCSDLYTNNDAAGLKSSKARGDSSERRRPARYRVVARRNVQELVYSDSNTNLERGMSERRGR